MRAPERVQLGPTALKRPEIEILKGARLGLGDLALRIHGNYGKPGLKPLTVGPPNSAGPGFRFLRVPNG